jgi:hypothetical protein
MQVNKDTAELIAETKRQLAEVAKATKPKPPPPREPRPIEAERPLLPSASEVYEVLDQVKKELAESSRQYEAKLNLLISRLEVLIKELPRETTEKPVEPI